MDSLNNYDVSQKQIKIGLVKDSKVNVFLFKLLKYIFNLLNLFALISSSWSLFGPNEIIKWHYENSLLILGLMFGMVLSFVAIYGSMKEEAYLILTYNLFLTAIYFVAFIYKWRPLLELLCFGFYLFFSYVFAYLVYVRHPVVMP